MTLTNKELRKEKTKQSIKDAALELAREEGWGGVTIRKIADKVLYSAPIVYEHFKNKDDLYKHLVQDGFHKLSSTTISAMENADTPEDKIMELARVRMKFVIDNPTLHHMMFDADNPGWQKMELMKSMAKLKDYVFQQLAIISGEPEKSQEYFLNMICLIKGYTYFNDKMEMAKKMKVDFLVPDSEMGSLFINAIKRFIESIKSNR